MKTKAISLLYLITPCILIYISTKFEQSLFWVYVIGVYLFTLVGIVFFFRLRPCRFSFLLLGLILSPSLAFIYEYRLNSYFFSYLTTTLSSVYYAFPFVIVCLITLAIINFKNKNP